MVAWAGEVCIYLSKGGTVQTLCEQEVASMSPEFFDGLLQRCDKLQAEVEGLREELQRSNLARHDLERRIIPVRQSLQHRADCNPEPYEVAEARALVRILDGKDPACCGDPGDCQDCKVDPDFASNFE